ncbi:MAG: SUMF1/EgtB/PvdO family nonheme iron enzyme, partial [Candidatus Eisenbacteria bacterium]|nr:SUMF1/EgtB/PvdO family nonheme iron enzyme [Candidatus Eisenbacteria bacterium]
DFEQGTGAYDGQGIRYVPPRFVTDPYMIFLADSWRGMTVFFQIMDTPGALDFQRAGELRIFTYGYTKNLVYADGHVYVAEDQRGVTVVDATALPDGGLVLMDNFDTPGEALDIEHEDGFLFVADGPQGLQVMEILEDQQLEIVAHLALQGDCMGLDVHDGTAFIAADDAGLHVVDIRDPYHPTWLGNVASREAVGVAVGRDNVVCVADQEEGLIVFRGPDLPDDFTPPSAVEDLATRLSSTTAVTLSWTAPGDDHDQGQAALYDVRWANESISEESWAEAQELLRRPFPAEAGDVESMALSGLSAGESYYFALKTRDRAGNWSELSNVTGALLTTPTLADAAVSPDSGDVSTLFTYSVVYQDAEGDAPQVRNVLIDGDAFEMTTSEEAPDYTAGVLYEYGTNLDLGSHEYQFAFDDGHGPLVTTELAAGPRMPPDPFDYQLALIDVGAGATFTMGSPVAPPELGRDADELSHEVTLTRSFRISATEVTQTLYEAVMGQNPSGFTGVARPVETVTWYDAVAFCNALSTLDGLEAAYTISGETYDEDGHLVGAMVSWDPLANGYRLPTEAEWEYACRAGSATALANGELTVETCLAEESSAPDPLLDAMGWYCGNSDTGTGRKPQDVALKSPNAYGLYDLHGNVWEWCWDIYGEYSGEPQTDPQGPSGEAWQQHVRRGGHWDYYARDCRSASRDPFWPNSADDTTGFRFVRNAP